MIRKVAVIAACALFAILSGTAVGDSVDPSELRKDCKAGDADACEKLVEQARGAFIWGEDDGDDLKSIAEGLQVACDNGNHRGCTYLGIMYDAGSGVPQNYRRAVNLFERGCMRDNRACYLLASHRAAGKGTQRNLVRAERLYQKACSDQRSKRGGLRFPSACLELATLYIEGQVIPKDHKAAATIYRRACEAKDLKEEPLCHRWGACKPKKPAEVCHALGSLYAEGKGVEKNDKLASRYFRKACRKGDPEGCYAEAEYLAKGIAPKQARVDLEHVFKLYKKACDGGVMASCYMLGFLYERSARGAKDHARAAKLYRKACDGGEPRGCTGLGRAYAAGRGVAKSAKRAVKLYRKACRGGAPYGCANLGAAYLSGHGVAKNAARAVRLFDKSCSAGVADACARLGAAYSNGIGVARNRARGLLLAKKACDGGSPLGCNNFAWAKCHDNDICDEEAERLARKAVAASPNNAGIADTLGYVLCKRGKTEEGEKVYAKACKLAPKAGFCKKRCPK